MRLDNRLAAILESKRHGLSYKEIAETFSVSRQRVQQIMKPKVAVVRAVKARADGNCEMCSKHIGKSGHIHHESYDNVDFNSIGNLKYLCISCHRKTHRIIRSVIVQQKRVLTIEELASRKPIPIRNLDKDTYNKARIAALRNNQNLGTWVTQAIRERLSGQ